MTKLQEYFGKPLNEMTAADWKKVDDIIANFHGDQANLTKVMRYRRMEEIANELLSMGCIRDVETTPPQPKKMYACVEVEFSDIVSYMQPEMDLLKELFLLCDSIMSVTKGFTRTKFIVEDVWEGKF